MVATMPAKREAKVNLGVRVPPSVKERLEAVADEISRDRHPANVTAAELAAVAIDEFLERYDRQRAKGR